MADDPPMHEDAPRPSPRGLHPAVDVVAVAVLLGLGWASWPRAASAPTPVLVMVQSPSTPDARPQSADEDDAAPAQPRPDPNAPGRAPLSPLADESFERLRATTGCYTPDGRCPPPTECGPGIRGPGCLDTRSAPVPPRSRRRTESRPAPKPPRPKPPRVRREDLPEKLSVSDIKRGIQAPRHAAEACGPKHGARPGEKVSVKLTIEGSTGRVRTAKATGQHTGTALGTCTAKALAKSRFIRFRKPSMGFQFAVRF